MRRVFVGLIIAQAAAVGCGGSRQEVRTYSSVPIEPPQAQLDAIAARFLSGVFGAGR